MPVSLGAHPASFEFCYLVLLGGRLQWEILRLSGIPEEEISKVNMLLAPWLVTTHAEAAGHNEGQATRSFSAV